MMKQVLFLLLIVLIFGCSKEKTSSPFVPGFFWQEKKGLPREIEVLGFPQLQTDGEISLTSFATLSTQDLRGPEVMIRGFGYSKAGDKSDFGTLNMDTIAVNPVNITNPDYLTVGAAGAKELFGKTVPVYLEGKNGLPGFSTQFYIPDLMTITSPLFSNYSVIIAGTVITWVSNHENISGVGISLSYDPYAVENHGRNFAGSAISHTVRVPDTGSYTITEKDLAGIPVNARLTLNIGRGNYRLVKMQQDYSFGLLTFSTVTHTFTRR